MTAGKELKVYLFYGYIFTGWFSQPPPFVKHKEANKTATYQFEFVVIKA